MENKDCPAFLGFHINLREVILVQQVFVRYFFGITRCNFDYNALDKRGGWGGGLVSLGFFTINLFISYRRTAAGGFSGATTKEFITGDAEIVEW